MNTLRMRGRCRQRRSIITNDKTRFSPRAGTLETKKIMVVQKRTRFGPDDSTKRRSKIAEHVTLSVDGITYEGHTWRVMYNSAAMRLYNVCSGETLVMAARDRGWIPRSQNIKVRAFVARKLMAHAASCSMKITKQNAVATIET